MSAVINDAFAASASASMSLGLHVRHGAMIHVGMDSDVTVTEPGCAPVCGRVLVVPPDVPHTASCPGPCIGILYDPETERGMAGYTRARRRALPLDSRLTAWLGGAVIAHRASVTAPEILMVAWIGVSLVLLHG